MKKWNSVTISLQKEDIDIGDAQCRLDAFIVEYPIIEKYLSRNAQIKQSPDFENAIIKIVDGNESQLTDPESDTVENLKKAVVFIEEADDSVDFASSVFKRKKLAKMCMKSNYHDLRFLRPTSNIAERLFGKSSFAFNDLRQSILPMN